MSVARRAAFDVLRRVAAEDAYATNLLAAEQYERLASADHALLQELVLGTLRRQGQLDFLIEHYARRSVAKLDLTVVIALRLGLYQLRRLTRVPPHAAVNEAVKLVKEEKLKSAAPFVNAVLRAAQRSSPDAERALLQAVADPLRRLSIETSHPQWLLARWLARCGADETRQLAMAANAAPRVAFRFNPLRAAPEQTREWLTAHGISIRASALTPHAFVVENGALSADAEPVRNGWLYLQDEASQLVAHLAGNPQSAIRNPKLLDLCAAPGGKTTLLASLLPPAACIIAADVYAHRLRTLRTLAARLGVNRIQLLRLDATVALPFATEPAFDFVLLDAPCSGLGTLQRHPEIKWRLNEAKIAELAALQSRLLANAATQVRPGGLLTYAVCSTEPEEGEAVIEQFRRAHSEFRDLTRERLTELGLDPSEFITAEHGARTFAHRHGTESFFFCVLWKRR